MKIVVLCPHFEPDTAPTGVVMTRIVDELADRGHELHVVTSLPWYRRIAIEPGWTGRWIADAAHRLGIGDAGASLPRRRQVQPGPSGARFRRLLGRWSGVAGLRAGGWFRRADAVVAMSPPLTLGIDRMGWSACVRRAPLVFNVQDVFPDAAVAHRRDPQPTRDRRRAAGSSGSPIAGRRRSPCSATTCARNVAAKLGRRPTAARVHVIPNFVDTDGIRPCVAR